MNLRFFSGINDKEIHPRKSDKDTAAHYAWCLEQLIVGLHQASNDDKKRQHLIERFEVNMNMSPGTQKMLKDVDTLFSSLVRTKPLPDNDYIISCLKGLPIEDDRSYISYIIKNNS